jgi:hypothetical protein
MKTFTEIKAMYPYQFEGKNIGLSIANGWLPGFAKLCRDIDTRLGKNKRDFHWVQLKEKFGSARYYWAMNNLKMPVVVDIITPGGVAKYANKPKMKGNNKTMDKTEDKELVDELNILISEASDRTLESCIVCGENGKPDNLDYYTLVLCIEHKRARHAGEELDIWPSESEE